MDCSENNENIENYYKFIELIYQAHLEYCDKWLSIIDSEQRINLNSKQIRDIINNKCINRKVCSQNFLKYMQSFNKNLDTLQWDIASKIIEKCDSDLEFRHRIKEDDSTYIKILRKSKHQDGKFPIKKCINDLLGFRIIEEDMDSMIEQIEVKINELKENDHRIKFIRRIKSDYKGYHIYFGGSNNYCFPIELQLWNRRDKQSNNESHRIRKQKHLKWIKEFTEF
jgi:hypothetical protein